MEIHREAHRRMIERVRECVLCGDFVKVADVDEIQRFEVWHAADEGVTLPSFTSHVIRVAVASGHIVHHNISDFVQPPLEALVMLWEFKLFGPTPLIDCCFREYDTIHHISNSAETNLKN